MSPRDFEMCREAGGKMRTKILGKNKMAHVCIDKNGKSHMGEIKARKK